MALDPKRQRCQTVRTAPARNVHGVDEATEFPLVQVGGTAFEMGQQHGYQAAHLIRLYLDFIAADAESRAQKMEHALTYVPGITDLNPRYMEEVRGLADGANISFGEAMLCQTRGAGPVDPPANDEGCTAFAFAGDATSHGQTLAGQNQDISPAMVSTPFLLRCH